MRYFLIVILSFSLLSCFEEEKEMIDPILNDDGTIDMQKIEELPKKIEEEIAKKIEETKKDFLEEPTLEKEETEGKL